MTTKGKQTTTGEGPLVVEKTGDVFICIKKCQHRMRIWSPGDKLLGRAGEVLPSYFQPEVEYNARARIEAAELPGPGVPVEDTPTAEEKRDNPLGMTHSCAVCGKEFKTKAGLAAHMRVHGTPGDAK